MKIMGTPNYLYNPERGVLVYRSTPPCYAGFTVSYTPVKLETVNRIQITVVSSNSGR